MADEGILGQIKQKLVDTKRKWADEGRLLTGAAADPAVRLPPGQREVATWPVLDIGIQPPVTTKDWKLTVDGLVENPVAWDWAAFQAEKQEDFVSDIHCVTAWSRFDNRWRGVSTRRLLEIVRPRAEAKFVVQHSYDGYTTNVPLEYFAADDVLLAHEWEGKPISREHGGPVRLILPKLYLWKSAKWLTRIEFVAEDRAGFWEVRGYHMRGDPWTEERYG
ncbi:MAG: sulfite oxidase-like oxidoreductase [Rhodospirillales bacterium]|nr:sulfite oxidase-like oxidoreductase [Rhodospirillales bacterium]